MSKHLGVCRCPPDDHCQKESAWEKGWRWCFSLLEIWFLKSLFSSLSSRLRGDQRALCCTGCLRGNILCESCTHGAFIMLMSLSRTTESSSHSHSVQQLCLAWFTHCSWKAVGENRLLCISCFISFKPPSSCQPLSWWHSSSGWDQGLLLLSLAVKDLLLGLLGPCAGQNPALAQSGWQNRALIPAHASVSAVWWSWAESCVF